MNGYEDFIEGEKEFEGEENEEEKDDNIIYNHLVPNTEQYYIEQIENNTWERYGPFNYIYALSLFNKLDKRGISCSIIKI